MHSTHPLGNATCVDDAEAWLSDAGTIFTRFEGQDSGCVSYGVATGEESWFVKVPTTRAAGESTGRAVRLHAAVGHGAIIGLHHAIAGPCGPILIYPWVTGVLLRGDSAAGGSDRTSPTSAMMRLRALPVPEVNAAIESIIGAHIAVERAGFVSVDFYDGTMMYDFDQPDPRRRIWLCDLDEYRPGPFRTETRLPGSTRYMAPEDWGGTIDSRTMVFHLGRALTHLLAQGEDSSKWRGTRAQLALAERATAIPPGERFRTVVEFAQHWHRVSTDTPD